MKNIFTILIILLLIIGCSPKELPTVSIVDKNGFFLKASHQTTKQELKDFQSEIAKIHGINFDFSKTEFTEKNTIKHFNSVMSKGAFKAKCSADLFTLQYKYYGFQFNVKDNKILKGKTGFIE
ncbi:MAG: hypothetical protein V3V14_01065 [Saprospiraceae bacterium]